MEMEQSQLALITVFKTFVELPIQNKSSVLTQVGTEKLIEINTLFNIRIIKHH